MIEKSRVNYPMASFGRQGPLGSQCFQLIPVLSVLATVSHVREEISALQQRSVQLQLIDLCYSFVSLLSTSANNSDMTWLLLETGVFSNIV